MGTNYYLMYGEPEPHTCEHCGVTSPRRSKAHIGKSSAGWCFALHVDEEFKSLDDYRLVWGRSDSVITNEYGEVISVEDMDAIITKRKRERQVPSYCDTDVWYATNYAQRPDARSNGLARHQIGRWCIGHGDGPWDLMPGDFS